MPQLLTMLMVMFISRLFCQEDYSRYIVADSLKKVQVIKSKDCSKKINYLGAIKKTNGDTVYYIFSVFSTVKAAMVMHGHSEIIYLGKDLQEKKRYDVGMPEQLPYKLKNNTLYFKYMDEKSNKKQIFKNKVGIVLPKVMCVAPNYCD